MKKIVIEVGNSSIVNVSIDGKALENLRSFQFSASVDSAPTIKIEQIALDNDYSTCKAHNEHETHEATLPIKLDGKAICEVIKKECKHQSNIAAGGIINV